MQSRAHSLAGMLDEVLLDDRHDRLDRRVG
jgi:hypothetical protein